MASAGSPAVAGDITVDRCAQVRVLTATGIRAAELAHQRQLGVDARPSDLLSDARATLSMVKELAAASAASSAAASASQAAGWRSAFKGLAISMPLPARVAVPDLAERSGPA